MEAKHRQALGIIETLGYTPLVEAVDAAIKAALVRLKTITTVTGGLVTATVSGEVGAVGAALSAAEAVMKSMNAHGGTHLIARPDSDVWKMLENDGLAVPGSPGPQSDPGAGGGGADSPPTSAAVRPEVPQVRPAAGKPASRPEAGTPVVKEPAQAPAIKAEAKTPAVKTKAQVPAVKLSGLPQVKPESKVPVVKADEGSKPAEAAPPATERKKEKTGKPAPGKKKPRKSTKK